MLLSLAAATLATVMTASPVMSTTAIDPNEVTARPSQMLSLPAGYDGSGVRVGVIDSGIAVEPASAKYGTNPCFTDESYSATDQIGQTKYTNNKVISARVYGAPAGAVYPGGPSYGMIDAEALSLHGSHVAGIIACNEGTVAEFNGQSYPMRGVAPKATLGSYNVFPGLPLEGVGPNDSQIAQAVIDATTDGMDVLNLSLSSGRRAAPETQAALNAAFAAGIIPVVAAGNDGPDQGTVGSPANNLNAITVGALETGWANQASASVGSRTFSGTVAEFIDVTTEMSGEIFVTKSTGPAPKPAKDLEEMPNPLDLSLGCTLDDYAGAAGKVALVARGTCTFEQKVAKASRAGAAALVIVNFDDNDLTPVSSGGPVVPAMIVGLSSGKALVKSNGSVVTLSPAHVQDMGSLSKVAWFSSQGPTTSGLSKPDVLAPGGGILSAAAGVDCKEQAVCFAMESGTSMAAPAVAGVVALVKQAHPDWSAAMVRSAVIHTATQDPSVPVRIQGAGVVNASAAINSRLGLDVTGVAVKNGSSVTVNVLNPTDVDLVVSAKVAAAPKDTLHGSYTVTPSVVVPANSQAPITISVSGSKFAATAMLNLTTQDGFAIHSVISTVK